MSELSNQKRDELKRSDFAYVDQQGERHLPIHDEAHVRNAVARFSQTQFGSKEAKQHAARQIVSAAKHYGIDLSDDDAVVHAAHAHD
ncbi:hypothetical protein DKM44_05160 [Deinococcus irradiatisoli]|uniref:Uncharacterized protein n=1 Tax=Deinococcus irradiatisoli TaxID=2202254 RepID=A0A2Z3JLP4_9DEIO|nr:DUF6582 domain-containing protein [Deinococcus irradiatisoli]AWN22698.1 hypothetical protein DKM44_05160 [Deinococcus irradiatisoli]